MEHVAAAQPVDVDLISSQLRARAAVGEHRALAGVVDHRDHDAAGGRRDRPDELDASRGDLGFGEPGRAVLAALGDQPRVGAESGSPGGDVRSLPACRHVACSAGVSSPDADSALEADDDVEQEVAEGADEHSYNRLMPRAR